MGDVTIGLVGCGRWGANVRRVLDDQGVRYLVADPRHPEADARSVVDLPDVDGWIVATPATTHAEVLDHLAERTGPVFCEKPLTTDLGDARRVVERLGRRLTMMHIWRHHPGVQALGRLVRDGAIGRPTMLRTFRCGWTSPRTDTDPVWTLVPHDLTIAVEVLGRCLTPASAVAETLAGQPVGLVGTLRDGPLVHVLEISTRYGDKRREIRVHGDEGVVSLAGDRSGEIVRIEGIASPPRLERMPVSAREPLSDEVRAFIDHVRGGPPPVSSASEGLMTVEVTVRLRELAGLGPNGEGAV